MDIQPGRIYSLKAASDSPYCLALVIQKQNADTSHVIVLYRPSEFDYEDGRLVNAYPVSTSLYSILKVQGRLDLLFPFMDHLLESKNFPDTCKHFGMNIVPTQQGGYYPDKDIVEVPQEAFNSSDFLPYAAAFRLFPPTSSLSPTILL